MSHGLDGCGREPPHADGDPVSICDHDPSGKHRTAELPAIMEQEARIITIHDLRVLATRLAASNVCEGNQACKLMVEMAEALGAYPGGLPPGMKLPVGTAKIYQQLEALVPKK